MPQKTICYANTIDYDFKLQQRPHHILNIMSKRGWKVYYVNQNPHKDGKIRERINENVEIYYDWNVFLKRVPFVDVHLNSWAARHVDIDQLESKIKVYDSLDSFPSNEYAESDMIRKNDIVLVTSDPLYKLRKAEHDNIHMVKNACFAELGDKNYSIPQDLIPFKATGKPIILFSGALAADWINLDLVEKIASKYQLLVVGMAWGIKEFPKNVHFLGDKKYEELQAYYHHCDVTILPFQRGQIADYSSPLKVYESLSHGKPVIATDIPEMTLMNDVVLVSKNNHEFMKNIDIAIKLSKEINYTSKLKSFALDNTWNHRVDAIEKAISEFENLIK